MVSIPTWAAKSQIVVNTRIPLMAAISSDADESVFVTVLMFFSKEKQCRPRTATESFLSSTGHLNNSWTVAESSKIPIPQNMVLHDTGGIHKSYNGIR